MSVRLPVVGAATAAAPGHGARAARMTIERRALTVASLDGSAESFARVLAEALQAQGMPAVLLARRVAQGDAASGPARVAALASPGTLLVVSDRALALELEGLLDVWVGPRPLPGGDAVELAAHASCQLDLRTGHESVARLLAGELAEQVGKRLAAAPA